MLIKEINTITSCIQYMLLFTHFLWEHAYTSYNLLFIEFIYVLCTFPDTFNNIIVRL